MTKISVNQKECLGCSFCGDCLPEIFEVDRQDFRCKLKKDGELADSASFDLTQDQLKKLTETVSDCPVSAIKLLE